MTRYHVDSARVDQAAAQVGATADTIQVEVDRMMHHLLDLEQSWQGRAAAGFQGLVQQWRRTQELVRSDLVALRTALDAAARTYADAEGAATRMFGG